MGGWIPTPADGWPAIAEALRHPWPESAAVTDLRWHVDQGSEVPGRRLLMRRWGWSEWAVRSLLRAEDTWRDPLRGGVLSRRPPGDLPVTSRRTTGEASQPGDILPVPSRSPPAPLHTRVVDPPSPSPSQQSRPPYPPAVDEVARRVVDELRQTPRAARADRLRALEQASAGEVERLLRKVRGVVPKQWNATGTRLERIPGERRVVAWADLPAGLRRRDIAAACRLAARRWSELPPDEQDQGDHQDQDDDEHHHEHDEVA